MADWYYSEGDDQKGPVPEERLRDMIASGKLRPSDSAWRQGMADWAQISAIPELTPAGKGSRGGRDDDYEDRRGRQADRDRGRERDDDRRARDDDRDYDARRSPARSRPKKVTFFAILLLAGAFLWLVNFFLPWWGFSVRSPSPDTDFEVLRRADTRMDEIMRTDQLWHMSHVPISKKLAMEVELERMRRDDRPGSTGYTLLGLNTGTGLFAFIVAIVILGAVITSLFVGILAEWRWTAAFLFALLGIILLIFGMLWLFGVPEADAPPIMSQGKIIGPYVHLVGTLAVIAGGVLEGVFGLLAFLRNLKRRPA